MIQPANRSHEMHRIQMYFGSSIGLFSEWSYIATTKDIRPPSSVGEPVDVEMVEESATMVSLSFGLPAYDGGSPIIG